MYLNCKTYFSFRYGTFGTEELVKAAVELGATALALTNINSTCDAWDFVKFCLEQNIKPILGAEIRNGDELLYILLAANNRGFRAINQFISQHLKGKMDFPSSPAADLLIGDVWDLTADARKTSADARNWAADGRHVRDDAGREGDDGQKEAGDVKKADANGLKGIAGAWSGMISNWNPGADARNGFVIYPLGKKAPGELGVNEYIGIRPAEVNRLFSLDMTTAVCREKLVIWHPVTFQSKTYYNVHRLLRCIDKNTLLSKLTPEETAQEDELFIPPAELMQYYRQYPFIITNTYKIVDACTITMEFGKDKNKKAFSATKADDMRLLKKLAYEGLQFRYGTGNNTTRAGKGGQTRNVNYKTAKERVDKELQIIDNLNFNSYFLITWDLIRYAQNRGLYYVGRGSGANSIVAYCLQITDVDPIELDLYFERFLNPYRTSPPDFDIDFSWLDRDEVIDYVFKRYGEDYVALLGMYSTFQFNAIIRELGKVFGLPKSEIDELGVKGYYYGASRADNFTKRASEDSIHRLIMQYGRLISNFPNHLSIHPGGMLISEEPIYAYTVTHLPPKNFNTTQIDMFVAESIGLFKLDILSQRGLGHIKEAIRLVRENRQIDVNIHAIEKFKQDLRVKDQIRTVNTIGCFYIESPAMRQLLKKLCCDDYITLVAASSIIRPGVASSGMMREYIFRFHNKDKFDYIHPIMKELLAETYGVMVYQEDVIKVAHHFAGLDMGEADILRRAMSGKYRGTKEMDRIRNKFFVNCQERGYPEETSKEVWRQIESFGGYSFSKAHSASFAVESYQSLYLKTYYPREFMVAVINNFGGFYSTALYFYELLKTGARIHLPSINDSHYFTSIHGEEVYTGLVHIKDIEQGLAERLLEERAMNGPYQHLLDLLERTDIPAEQLNILINIGALRFTGKTKKRLLWEANFLQKRNRKHLPASKSLFNEENTISFQLPDLEDDPIDDLYDEVEILGFPLRNPFELADDDPGRYTPASEIGQFPGKSVTVLGYFVTHKVVPTVNNQTMSFGTFIDSKLDWIDTVHFPDALQRQPLQGRGFYRIKGKVVSDFGAFSIEVYDMVKVGYKERKLRNI